MQAGETVDSLRVHVRRGLDRFYLGHYFMDYGLQETVKLIPDDVDLNNLEASGLMDKHSPFQIFLKAVATEIVKDKVKDKGKSDKDKDKKGKKKRIKEYLEILQAFSEEWIEYIQKSMRKKIQKSKTSLLNSPDPKAAQVAEEGKEGAPGSSSTKKKGGKRGPRGPYKKRKIKEVPASPAPSIPISTKHQGDITDLETARKQFEAEKAKILEQVPESNKKLFNEVGFAKWGKSYLPAMALSPYGVPPGDIRELWMKMFQNVVKKDKIDCMGHLVWWIAPDDGTGGTYSVVPNNGFINFEEASAKGLHEIPAKIRSLLEKGKALNSKQLEAVEGLNLFNQLAMQAKDKREHPRSSFQEEEFWGIEDEEGENAAHNDEEEELLDDEDEDEDLLDDEDELLDSSTDSLTQSNSKKKGKKKRREKDLTAEEVVFDDIEEVVGNEPPKKRKRKDKDKAKKKQKKLDAKGDQEIVSAAFSAQQQPVEMQVDMPVDATTDVPVEEMLPSLKPSFDPLEEEPSVSGEDSALNDSDFMEDDDDTDPKKMKKLQKKGYKKKDKAKAPIQEEHDEEEEKKAKKKKKKGKKEKKDKKGKTTKEPKKRSKAAEQREFERCEEEYLPSIEELKMAKDMKDAGLIQQVLENLLPVAEYFTASFFSEYDIPRLMKATKTVLEEENGDTSTYRKLWNKMKASYTVKVHQLPDGFKAKKRDEEQQIVKATSATVKDEDHSALLAPSPADNAASTGPDNLPKKDINDASVPSTSLKVANKDGKRRLSADSDQLSKAIEKTQAAPKPKPKKFSIMDIMGKKKEKQRLSSGVGADKAPTSTPSGIVSKKTVPSWVTTTLPEFDSFMGSDNQEDRLFALEFLLQAAAHFPCNKGVNKESVARSLEMEIYDWSISQTPSATAGGCWSEIYWDRIHAVVAALTGKREIGTLVSMILDGCFTTPKAIVALSVEKLESSFEGRPLSD